MASKESGPTELLVMQPTPFCNIDCSYCYLPNRAKPRIMSREFLRRALEFALESPYLGDRLHVIWHAGEPLSVSRDYYEEAFQLSAGLSRRRHGKPIRIIHSIQTNGTLLDQGWCELFLAYGVLIGVSLDGPPDYHDARRKTRAGLGTSAKVLAGLRLLNENSVPFSVLTVLSRGTLSHPEALFDFYRQNAISRVGFNVDEVTGANKESSIVTGSLEQLYLQFMVRASELSEAAPRIQIRELRRFRRDIVLGRDSSPSRLSTPLAVLNVDWEGNLSTFCPELLTCNHPQYPDGFTLGNICSDTLETVLQSPKFLKMAGEINSGVERCRSSCEYFSLCGGGAPRSLSEYS